LALGAVGAVVLLASRRAGRPAALALLLLVPPAYMALRLTGVWSGEGVVEWVGSRVDEERAQSLEFRLRNEDLLIDRALEQPAFGWGGWGRSRVVDDTGRDLTVTDGLWVIALGDRGFFGLAAVWA